MVTEPIGFNGLQPFRYQPTPPRHREPYRRQALLRLASAPAAKGIKRVIVTRFLWTCDDYSRACDDYSATLSGHRSKVWQHQLSLHNTQGYGISLHEVSNIEHMSTILPANVSGDLTSSVPISSATASGPGLVNCFNLSPTNILVTAARNNGHTTS